MIIAIPSEQRNLESNVCPSFGRTPFFLLYDTKTNTSRFLDNGAAAASGGAGIKAAQMIVDNRVDCVLMPHCGENAAEVLREGKIELYQSIDGTLQANIDALVDGKLAPLENIHAGFHRHDR